MYKMIDIRIFLILFMYFYFEILEILDKMVLKKISFFFVIDRYKKRKENFFV